MKRFRNVRAANAGEAARLVEDGRARGESVILAAGGSDLLGMIKDELAAPDVVVDLKGMSGHREIEPRKDGLAIGGLVTLRELSEHDVVRESYTVVAEAAGSVGTPQIRNVGTLAGNLCQRPWCWYFRQGFPCFKNGGDTCFSWIGENQFNAIFGGGPSYIVHPSDTAPALVALDAEIRIAGPSGERLVPAGEFFVLPEEDVRRENVLEPGEIVTGVELRLRGAGARSTYAKVMDREAWTHAVVSVAVALELEEGICRKARVVLGGVAPIPWQVPEVDGMLVGHELTPELAARAGREAVRGAQPLSKNAYKVTLTENLVRRTLMELAG